MKLALMPLPIFLLPNGITRLKIFEQRYIRMVKESTSGTGFAISHYYPDLKHNVSQWATWVKIINFDPTDGGLLNIDIQAQSMLHIDTVEIEKDKLRRITCHTTPHWHQQVNDDISHEFSEKLKQVFKDNPVLNSFYPSKHYEDINWVCSRWLEIIPVDIVKKTSFISPNSFEDAKEFLEEILIDKKVIY